MTSKRFVLIGTLLGAVVLLAAGARTWVHGVVTDVVLQNSTVSVSGSQAASGAVIGALVAAAGAVATLTGGRIVRVIGALATLLAGVLVLVQTTRVLLDPHDVVGEHAAETTGRTGEVDATGVVTAWPWLALVAALVLTAAGLLALVRAPRWAGLSARYESPADTDPARPTRAESDWDRLSRGDDPTTNEPARERPAGDEPAADDASRD